MTGQSKHILLLASSPRSLVNFRGPLIRDLLFAGHKVSAGAPDITPELQVRLQKMGAAVHETPLQRTGAGILADIRYGAGLQRLMARERPDIVLTYTIKPNIWGAFAAWRLGIPSVAMVTGLGYAFTEGGTRKLRQRLVRGIARRLYRAATDRNRKVIFQNPDDPRDFVALGCLRDETKIAIVNGSGVDLQHYVRTPLPEAPVFLMIARLLRNKGVAEYGEAALRVLAKYPQARFLLVGPFDEGPDTITRAELDRWANGGLEYLGPSSDVRTVLDQARIFVLPSYREGTPRSVLEAMATGRCVITSDAPGCRETVHDGQTGFLVPARDVDALSKVMEIAINDPELIACMAEASWRLARDRYEVGAVNREVMRHLGL
ncbi:glycosyltransferase family 4 protein [Notoacmeibacter sp. MSK16QG-6]|uniref:glycosyltransferase family 4 protein n=1 Tax=Notoacmeibacter sp. MSK16QG-6 TaxID=2957982 RepID=UPI0020A0A6FE|nr:glycosyltransferase family 4 protein [Notoacmeibacter sp. MSK16QG-6]MCP1198057.1 glycosyltransferase family 4 protein [Notoacmeibacter sp. MSK16QG-6]